MKVIVVTNKLQPITPLEPLKLNNVQLLILHHPEAKKCTWEDINQWHKNQGWSCAGYNEFIRKDGTVYILRGDNVGAQCKNHNSISYGICCEGDYAKETVMPAVQFDAIVARVKYHLNRFKKAQLVRHGDINPTSCPGQYFPYKKVLEVVYKMVFKDDASVSKWAKEAVNIVSDAGIMKGDYDGNFRPQDNITREEVAVMQYNLLKYLGKLPK